MSIRTRLTAGITAKTIRDHVVSGALGAVYGGAVGAAGGTIGVAGGVATGVVGAVAWHGIQEQIPDIKLKFKTAFIAAAAGFGLSCNACSPTLAPRIAEIFSRKEAPPPAYPLPVNMPAMPFHF